MALLSSSDCGEVPNTIVFYLSSLMFIIAMTIIMISILTAWNVYFPNSVSTLIFTWGSASSENNWDLQLKQKVLNIIYVGTFKQNLYCTSIWYSENMFRGKMCSEEKYLQANYLAGMCMRAFQSYLTCMSLVLKK